MEGRHHPAHLLTTITLAALIAAVWIVGSAAAAGATEQDTMTLSSWIPAVEEGTITGGSQTVTLINTGQETTSAVTFDTRVHPCDCSVVGRTLSRGTLRNGVWIVTNLAPGETATMSVQYDAPPDRWQSSPFGIPSRAGRFPL